MTGVLIIAPSCTPVGGCYAQAIIAAVSAFSHRGLPWASISASTAFRVGSAAADAQPAQQRGALLDDQDASVGPGRRNAIDKSVAAPLCAGCGKQLTEADLADTPPPGGRRTGSDLATPGGPVLECICCHRCFHNRCHRRWAEERLRQAHHQHQHQHQQPEPQPGRWKRWLPWKARGANGQTGATAGADGGASTVGAGVRGLGDSGSLEDEDDGWFHSRECWQVHRALRQLVRAGATPCRVDADSPLSVQTSPSSAASQPSFSTGARLLRDGAAGTASAAASCKRGTTTTADADAAEASSTAASSPDGELSVRLYDCRRAGVGTAVGLRRAHSVLRQEFGYSLADCRQFDYAAVLTRDHSAVSAALLDVYGSDLAELYLMATRTALQRRGYGTALVQHLSLALGRAGVRQLVVSVDDDDEANQNFWREKLGFEPLEASQLVQLGRTFGAFSSAAADGTLFLSRRLCLPNPVARE